jgi:6-pyruvoyltetrahydropterin/6-carboxytetrahydropterin synthase
MPVTRKVTVERNRLRFAAAHLATFGGGCEPLHGHNYDVFVEVEGDLMEDAWVWDFGDLKRATRSITEELDHKFLLQRESQVLEIEQQEGAWVVTFQDRRYVFPATDVAVLPIDNSTAERLAEWVAARLLSYLRESGAASLKRLTVGIEEMPGQAGWYSVDL